MLNVGQIVSDVLISDYSHEGLGVTKINEIVTFIPNTIKGERYHIKITQVKNKYCYGVVLNPINMTDCPYYLECGGCQIRHLDYEEQLAFKTQVVSNTLRKQGIKATVLDTIPNPYINHYRNKVIMPVKMVNNQIVCGYYAQQSHNLIAINDCQLIDPIVSNIIKDTVDLLNQMGERAYNEDTHKGNVRNIMVRQGFNTNEIMLCLVCFYPHIKDKNTLVKTLTAKYPQIKSIVINQHERKNNATLGFKNFNLYNCNFITEKLDDIKYRIEPNTFFQVNTDQAQTLYQLVRQYLQPTSDDIVLDAYCGVGSIGCFIARDVKAVVGVEVNHKSIKLANINSNLNNLTNTNFICGDMHDPQLALDYNQFNKVVVDPPRSGLDHKLITLLNQHHYERIVYVSCNPATLARDLKALSNYEIEQIQPVDMFSHTYHVECVVSLVNKQR